MNAIIQITEIHREQHQRHQERAARLWRGKPQPAPLLLEMPIDVQQLIIEAKRANVRGKVPQAKVIDVLAEKDERIRRLELDLADARARILSQAEMLCQLEDGPFTDEARRPVAVIVAEVLADYPDITWEEIKSVRRTNRLIGPRSDCVEAVFLQRPDLSSTQIGKIFARDHSSILHCIRKMAKHEKMTSR